MYDQETKDFAEKLEQEVQNLGYRPHHFEDERGDHRNDYTRDYARILYSSSFRRLQGKMQLLGIDPTHFHRNRLTHSLEVAQIARTIAENLEMKQPVVTEACSLAHDIGNPPFGHCGEKILNDLADGKGGFEGNAQTFRILNRLEKKSHEFPGLNLSMRTLWGVTKYNKKRIREEKKEKFLYDDDYEFLNEHLQNKNIVHRKSIDMQIMDLADEIAYAAHDLEDALSSGIVTIGEILHEFYISNDYRAAYDKFSEIVQKIRAVALKANRLNTSEEYAVVLRKELTSTIVNELCGDIGLIGENHYTELGYKEFRLLAKGLKKLLFKAILRKKNVQLYEKRGEKVIRGLFDVYIDKKYNENLSLLPPEYRALEGKYLRERLVVDYIAGMMDSYAIKEYQEYYGIAAYEKAYWK